MELKKTYAIMWTQGTYETDHISLLCDSTIPIVLSACFFMYFIVVQKKSDHIRGNMTSEKKCLLWNQYYFDLPKN